MNNSIIFLAIVLVLAGGAFFVFMPKAELQKEVNNVMMEKSVGKEMIKENETMTEDDSMKKDDGAMMEKPEGAMMAKGSYEAYAPEKLAKAKEGDVVLFFRASWCPTCRALDADIKANLGSIPAGVTILDVNYDDSTPLKQKYGVTYQHTFVQVDADGAQLAKWSKSPTLAALLSEVK
jgi:thiol-disulfide isomerase/thioredoxin